LLAPSVLWSVSKRVPSRSEACTKSLTHSAGVAAKLRPKEEEVTDMAQQGA